MINFIPNAQKITNQCATHKSLAQQEHVLNSICITEKKVNYLCKMHIPMQNSVVKICLLYGANCVFAPAACGAVCSWICKDCLWLYNIYFNYMLQSSLAKKAPEHICFHHRTIKLWEKALPFQGVLLKKCGNGAIYSSKFTATLTLSNFCNDISSM